MSCPRSRRTPSVEVLDARALLTADAVAVWDDLNVSSLVSETQNLQLQFDNSGNTTGYGPFVDLVIPTRGEMDAGGLRFVSGSSKLLDASLRETVVTFNANGLATHPLAKDSKGNAIVLNGIPGYQLVVLELPFGSFVGDQPIVQIDMQVAVSADAALGQALPVIATGGFRFGLDPLDNPSSDPSLRGRSSTALVTPSVIKTKVEYLGPESETATGENFQRGYRVLVDIANGANVSDLRIVNQLDKNVAFLALSESTWSGPGFQVTKSPMLGVPEESSQLITELPGSVGVQGIDGSYVVRFFVPEMDANDRLVIDPVLATNSSSWFSSQVSGNWNRPSPTQATLPTSIAVSSEPAVHRLQNKTIAAQQSVRRVIDVNSRAIGPGDTLEYTIDFQVSDFVSLDNLRLVTAVPNGQTVVESSPVSFSLTGVPGISGNQTSQFSLQNQGLLDSGATSYLFDLSRELRSLGLSSILHGGLTQQGQGTAVTGKVVFRALILDQFPQAVPSGDASVDENDIFRSSVSVTGTTIDPISNTSSASSAMDGSNVQTVLASGRLETSVYAINGIPVTSQLQVSPGDLVTYRIRRNVFSSDVEDLTLSDYLPLPVHKIGQMQWIEPTASASKGSLQLGPSDSFHKIYGSMPRVSIDANNNRISFTYNDFDSSSNQDSMVDLLVTVAVEDSPFADGLWLTSTANATSNSSNNGSTTQNALTSIQYTRPILSITKGVASSDNPFGIISPANGNDGNISGVDAGDQVRFRIAVSNSGLSSKGAFDALIRDVLPAGFSVPASGLNLSVTDGLGKQVRYLPEGTGGDASLFGSGLRLIDPIGNRNSASESNQVFIEYTVTLNDSVRANTSIASEASIAHYAARPGGVNFVTSKIADSAFARVAGAAIVHTLVSTDQIPTTGSRMVVGETGLFRARVTIPEGQLQAAVIQMNLPRGLSVKEVLEIQKSEAVQFLDTTLEGLKSLVSINATSADPRDGGRQLRIPIGSIVNSDRINANREFIEVVYSAVATNDFDNNRGASLQNAAVLTYATGSSRSSTSVSIVEPEIDIVKTSNFSRLDAMDKATISIDVRALASGASTAYDVALVDTIPAGTSYIPGSLRWVSGKAKPESMEERNGTLAARWSAIAMGENSRLEYDVIVKEDVQAGARLVNRAEVQWSSLPGMPGQLARSNALSFERTGNPQDPGLASNDYRKSAEANLAIAPVQLSIKLVETSFSSTAGSQVTIGEQATYEVVATIPEGVHKLSLSGFTSSLDSLLWMESLELVSIGRNLSGEWLRPGLRATLDNSVRANMELGIVRNEADNVSSEADQLVLRLVTRVPNHEANTRGDTARVEIRMDFQNAIATVAAALTMVEPGLLIRQSLSQSSVDGGDVVDAVLMIEHASNSTSSATEVDLVQLVDGSGLSILPGSVQATNAKILQGNSSEDRSIRIASMELKPGESLIIQFKMQVSKDAQPGGIFQLPVALSWKSMSDQGARSYTVQTSTQIRVNASTLAGSVTVDTNQDGIQQVNDFGVGAVEIQLKGIDHLGNSIHLIQLTDGNGRFAFEKLRPGVYAIAESQPDFLFDGLDFAGVAGGRASNDVFSEIALHKGSDGLFGGYRFTESPLTWISGTVFVDEDANRRLGPAEEGVEGITITLTGINDLGVPVERMTKTNARGYYVFDYLDPGTYSIVEGDTPGFFDAWEELGNRGGFVGNDRFHGVRVTASRPGQMYNFGEYKPASISGQIYVDYDRDGVLDRKDGLVSNVDIVLTGINDLGEKVSQTSSTDAQGYYRFDSLRPGSYEIQSPSLDGLESSVSNVGMFNGASGRTQANGIGVTNGFRAINLPACAQGDAYNIGHVDPNYEPSQLENSFERTMVVNGTNVDDQFEAELYSWGGLISVNGKRFPFDNSQTLSLRILGSFGNDEITFIGSENKEAIDLRRSSARITGTWFESLIYGMENIRFLGGGNEDLARFYDTAGNDSFQASPMQASLRGEGYRNSVEDVHRIYAYASGGTDTAMLTGKAGEKDDFNSSPEASKLDGNDFYLFTSGFDTVQGFATDSLDRAHLFDSAGNDQFTATENQVELTGGGRVVTAYGYAYVLASAWAGGRDSAVLTGSSGDDQLTSRPLDARWNTPKSRIDVEGFESLIVQGALGADTATIYDSHSQDVFTANPSEASLRNATGDVTLRGFEQIAARMDAGGEDRAVIYGSTQAEVFKASPTSWSLQGSGYVLTGVGFTQVTAYGGANDLAYLYDSAFNDLLELTPGSAVLSGQQYRNEAMGFGKVNAESIGGFDRVLFFDSILRSTVRYTEPRTTIFGTGFSHNATGFDTVDAYYADLNGLDNVELNGRVAYAMLASDIARFRHKLTLRTSLTAPVIDLKTRVDRL